MTLLLFTFFNVQRLAGIDLHLHLPVSIIIAEPAVARKHVLLPVNRHRELHAVQKPSGLQALIGVTNEHAFDLEAGVTHGMSEPIKQW